MQPKRNIKHHSTVSPRAFLKAGPTSNPPFGTGQTLLVSDTGLDIDHCMFYDGAIVPHATLFIDAQAPVMQGSGKIKGIVNTEYATGQFTNAFPANGAHGTSTSGLAVGMTCQDGNSGVAPNAGLLFLDMTGKVNCVNPAVSEANPT